MWSVHLTNMRQPLQDDTSAAGHPFLRISRAPRLEAVAGHRRPAQAAQRPCRRPESERRSTARSSVGVDPAAAPRQRHAAPGAPPAGRGSSHRRLRRPRRARRLEYRSAKPRRCPGGQRHRSLPAGRALPGDARGGVVPAVELPGADCGAYPDAVIKTDAGADTCADANGVCASTRTTWPSRSGRRRRRRMTTSRRRRRRRRPCLRGLEIILLLEDEWRKWMILDHPDQIGRRCP